MSLITNQLPVNIIPLLDAKSNDIDLSSSPQKVLVTNRIVPKIVSYNTELQTNTVTLDTPSVNENNDQNTAEKLKSVQQKIDLNLQHEFTSKIFLNPDKFTSDFETEMSLLLSSISSSFKDLKLNEIQQTREANLSKIESNRELIAKAEHEIEQALEAKTASKIFGWFSSAISVIAGTLLIASGVGALAGAMLIASAVTSIAGQIINEAASAGLISNETMEWLGPTMTGIQVAVGIACIAVTFGGSSLSSVADSGIKIGAQLTELSTNSGIMYQSGLSLLGSISNVGNIISGTTSSILLNLSNKNTAESLEVKSAIKILQRISEKLEAELSKLFESNDKVMNQLIEMSESKSELLHKIINPKNIA